MAATQVVFQRSEIAAYSVPADRHAVLLIPKALRTGLIGLHTDKNNLSGLQIHVRNCAPEKNFLLRLNIDIKVFLKTKRLVRSFTGSNTDTQLGDRVFSRLNIEFQFGDGHACRSFILRDPAAESRLGIGIVQISLMQLIALATKDACVVFFSHFPFEQIARSSFSFRKDIPDMSAQRFIRIALRIDPGIQNLRLPVTGPGSKHLVHTGVQLLGCGVEGGFLGGHGILRCGNPTSQFGRGLSEAFIHMLTGSLIIRQNRLLGFLVICPDRSFRCIVISHDPLLGRREMLLQQIHLHIEIRAQRPEFFLRDVRPGRHGFSADIAVAAGPVVDDAFHLVGFGIVPIATMLRDDSFSDVSRHVSFPPYNPRSGCPRRPCRK
ncbi:MAG: hypothetical protein BWY83_01048 [bacterium ADurb.Bin478]|nr:MAG: hypothetical protein BWY83_01048 [bacterium ADurb.Bin478]